MHFIIQKYQLLKIGTLVTILILMVSSFFAKALLIVAFILGILQGLMTLIGGILSANDKNSEANDGIYLAWVQNKTRPNNIDIFDTEYYCAAMKIKEVFAEGNYLIPNEVCGYSEMDRGWYKRLHDYCKTFNCDDTKFKTLNGWGLVLSESIICGIGWIFSGLLALLGIFILNKIMNFLTGGIFAMFYVLFIVLFSIGWKSVMEINQKCLDKLCKDVSAHGKRSSRQFLACGISSAFTILVAIICCIISAFGIEKGAFTYKETKNENADQTSQ